MAADPFGSMVPFCHISSSQDPSPSPTSFDDDSQQSETYKRLRVQPTAIRLVSPPTSAEANDGTPSQDKFETPPEEAVPAASSEERWFGCEGEAVVAGEEKTVDLYRDTDLGFSETEMPQRTAAESESGGFKLLKVEIGKNQWTEFVKWKKKMAFRERLLEEQPVKELVCEKSSKLDSTGAGSDVGVGVGVGVDEEKSREDMFKSVSDLKPDSGVPGLKSVESLQMRNQMSIKSNECTKSVSLDSEVKSHVLGARMLNYCMELNVSTQVVSSVSGGKDHISEVGMGTSECTKAVNLGSEGKRQVADAGMCKPGLDSKDCGGVVGLDSRSKGLVVDAGMDENVVESNDHTEAVSLGSGGKGLVSDQGIAKNHMEANSSTQTIMLDSEDNDMVLDEDTLKLGMSLDGSTEEIVADSGDGCLVMNEVIAKRGLESNISTQVVEDEGLVSSADVAKKKPTLSRGTEKVDNTPDVGKSKKSMHSGKGMGGLKNIEDIEKFRYVSPSDSNSKQTLKLARVLPLSIHAPGKEGDYGKNPSTQLLSFALRKLPKTDRDPTFKKLSLKEIAQRRRVTFPKPSWWVKEDNEG